MPVTRASFAGQEYRNALVAAGADDEAVQKILGALPKSKRRKKAASGPLGMPGEPDDSSSGGDEGRILGAQAGAIIPTAVLGSNKKRRRS